MTAVSIPSPLTPFLGEEMIMKEVILNGTAFIAIATIVGNVVISVKYLLTTDKPHNPDHTVGYALVCLVPIVSYAAAAVAFIDSNADGAMLVHGLPKLFCWSTGLVFCQMAMRLMVAHLCVERLALFPLCLVIYIAGSIHSHFSQEAFLGISQQNAMYIQFIVQVALYAHFWVSVINDMTTILKIRCFRVKSKTKSS
jgi:hypothetical protein